MLQNYSIGMMATYGGLQYQCMYLIWVDLSYLHLMEMNYDFAHMVLHGSLISDMSTVLGFLTKQF